MPSLVPDTLESIVAVAFAREIHKANSWKCAFLLLAFVYVLNAEERVQIGSSGFQKTSISFMRVIHVCAFEAANADAFPGSIGSIELVLWHCILGLPL